MHIAIIYSVPDLTTLSWCLQYSEIPARYFKLTDSIIPAAGYILANASTHSAALITFLTTEAAHGKPILGIGTGAIALVQAGLVPGLAANKSVAALTTTVVQANATPTEYIQLTPDYQYNAFTRHLSLADKISVTSTTAFIVPPALAIEVAAQGLNILQYCHNNNIAALANKNGNIMALLPELSATATNAAIFSSMRDHINSGYQATLYPLAYWPR